MTGFISETIGEMAASVTRVDSIDRARCRAAFDQRFTARRMAQDYVKCYERLIEARYVAADMQPKNGRHSVSLVGS